MYYEFILHVSATIDPYCGELAMKLIYYHKKLMTKLINNATNLKVEAQNYPKKTRFNDENT